MPIDKIIPSYLNKSDDERLIKKNEMTDALNVTVSTDTDGNAFVLKNAKGTISVLKNAAGDLIDTDYSVLGSCVDQEEETVYFVAYDNSGNDHAIFRVDMSAATPTYEEVFADSLLFESATKPEYVDMDVLRADVNQSGTIVPILYFTDGVNSPKKINVSRAMDASDAGGYTAASADVKEFLDVAKTKPVHQFYVECGTDVSFDGNFLYGRSISFCIQWVYKDGEHSALSNLSEICIPQVIFQNEEDGRKPVAGNFFYFDVPVGTEEVKEINIIYRDNETGVYYIADRIEKGSDVTRSGHQVWDDSESKYYFYGDQDHEVVANIEALKLYDNVPLKAKTQTIVDGRLMYGNYTESREVPEIEATFTPQLNARYADDLNTHSYTSSLDATLFGAGHKTADIELDLSNLQSTFYPGDSVYMDFTFSYDKLFGIRTVGTSFITATSAGGSVWECGQSTTYPMIFKDLSFRFRLEYRYTGTGAITKSTFISNIASAISGHELTIEYNNSNNDATVWDRTSGTEFTDPASVAITNADITFKFFTSVAADVIEISPKIKTMSNIDTANVSFGTGNISYAAPSNVNDCETGEEGSSATAPTLVDVATTAIIKDFYSYRTYKAGANHTFGMIFYDDKGRSSFVRELGSVYIPTLGERRPSERGLARVDFSFNRIGGVDQTVPSWVDKIQFVYGGSDVEEFKQYSVSGGFSSYWADSNYATAADSEDASDNIYVSLKGWSGSAQSYTGNNGADHIYNFKEGDVLRVISYDREDGTSGAETVYPDRLEFSVVGKRRLREDVTTSDIEAIRAQLEAEKERQSSVFVFDRLDKNEEVLEELEKSLRKAEKELKDIPLSKRNDVYPGDWAVSKGDFLVLKHNGASGWGPEDHKHIEFGGVAVQEVATGTATHGGNTAVATDNHWHPIGNWMRNVVVEIYTPKHRTKTKVYKELTSIIPRGTAPFGADGTLSTAQTELRSGDTWFKRTPVSTLSKNTHSFGTAELEAGSRFNYWILSDMTFEMKWLESEHASHFFSSHRHNFGRTHFVNKYAASNNRAYSITYSDKYNSDSPILNLSNFNLSKANYIDLPSSYSQIDRILSSEGDLTVIQGSKASRIPVGKMALKLATQTDLLTSADVVLGTPSFYAGDYGTRGLSQAVVKHDGRVFFVDYISRKVLQLGGDGLTDISAIGMDSFFEKNLGDWSALSTRSRLHVGYDPDYNEVLVFAGKDTAESFDGFCAAYNTSLNKWTSRYNFADADGAEPTLFEKIGDKLISCADSAAGRGNPSERTLFHIHDDAATKCNFYGNQQESIVEVVANLNPSMVKVFEAVSLESNTDAFDARITTSDQATDITSWEQRERGYYAMMPRDTSANSTSHKFPIGKISITNSIGNATITFQNKLSRIGIPYGAKLYNETTGATVTDDGLVSGNEITVTTIGPSGLSSKVIGITPSFTAGGVVNTDDVVSGLLSQDVYGDAIRDYFCKIKLTHTNSTGAAWELFTINAQFDRSNLGQEKG
jgi:hypothetical protein